MTLTSCPICKTQVPLGAPDFPFCCDRCRTLDLGAWASEAYVFSTPLQAGDMDLDEEE